MTFQNFKQLLAGQQLQANVRKISVFLETLNVSCRVQPVCSDCREN